MSNLNWALRYLKMGWSVIPVKAKSKEPAIQSWKEYQTRLPTSGEISEWFTKGDLNLGVVTGPVSNLVVLDADGPKGIWWLKAQSLRSPITCVSGRGRHLYFKWANGIRNSASKIADGIDVRGEGGYVVAPVSIHPNGQRYRFINAGMNVVSLPLLPEKLFLPEKPQQVTRLQESWISEALEDIKNGHTHNTLVRVLGKFRAHHFSEQDAETLLAAHAQSGGMSISELRQKISEIWERYEPSGKSDARTPIQSFLQGTVSHSIVIHNPGNADSWDQYNRGFMGCASEEKRLCTGFPKLDNMLEGGLKSERLFTLAARTGTGKTNFAIALSKALCRQDKKVLYFSTEFSFKKIWQRYAAYGEFRGDPFYVVDSFSPNLSQVEEAIQQVKPDVFIFDHINHLGEELTTLSTFMQGCNFLQRKYEAQGVMVAQLNRQADWVDNGQRVQPRMSMIKGSGTIEQASSRVLLLSETKQTPEMNEIVGVLDKNDSGDKGLLQFGLLKNPYKVIEL